MIVHERFYVRRSRRLCPCGRHFVRWHGRTTHFSKTFDIEVGDQRGLALASFFRGRLVFALFFSYRLGKNGPQVAKVFAQPRTWIEASLVAAAVGVGAGCGLWRHSSALAGRARPALDQVQE
tara:strand:- start:612 stop:977 length:366 start_codon:yes stop_codon:yes gene_type:complete